MGLKACAQHEASFQDADSRGEPTRHCMPGYDETSRWYEEPSIIGVHRVDGIHTGFAPIGGSF